MLNRHELIGHVGGDPEVKTLAGDRKVAAFSLATSEKWKDKNTGEAKEHTDWHRVVVWGELAAIVEKYVKKGSRIYVAGAVKTRKWEDAAGAARYTTETVLSGFDARMLLLDRAGRDAGPKSESDYGAQQEPGSGATGTERQAGGAPNTKTVDDEIPF